MIIAGSAGKGPDGGTRVRWDRKTLRRFSEHTGSFYRYAPCLIAGGAGPDRCWMCRNAVEGVIKDSIFYREQAGGGGARAERAVLAPAAPPAWDSFHVCDPSVVAGRFGCDGVRYRFALFYTGNNVDASRNNQVGVAFANDLAGAWVRMSVPLVAHADDGTWGVGQPSAVSVDRKGRVLLFYTCGDREGTRGLRRVIDLSDARHPIVGPALTLTNAGLTGSGGKPDYLNNADFAFAPTEDRFYAVREQHPYPADYPRYIGARLQIVSIAAGNVWEGGGAWRVEGEIGPELTGLPRNHNAGLARDRYGALPDPGRLRVVFASSCAGPDCKTAEWTYALWEIRGTLKRRNTPV